MSRWVLVDDTDSAIQYTGSWFQDQGSQNNLGSFGIPFESTLHGTNSGGSFSYTFQGTKVLITGSVQFPVASGTTTSNPSWVCSVDGVTTPSILSTAQENRIRFCETDGLADGVSHTITVQVTVSDQHTFWLDYVQYLPSSSANLDNAFISIDSSDSGLDYGSGWQAQSVGQMTTQTGSTLTFDFNGISLTWLGFYLNSQPMSATTATYSIDGQTPITFNLNGASSAATGVQYNQIFFQTGQLSPGDHKLQVVYQGSSQTTPLSITTLTVQNGGSTSSGTGSPSGAGSSGGTGTSSTSGTSSGSTTSGGSVSPSGTSNNPSASSTGTPTLPVHLSTSGSSVITVTGPPGSSFTSGISSLATTGADSTSGTKKSSNNIGAIVGGVVGGLAVLVLLIIAFLVFRQRKRRPRSNFDVAQPFDQPPMAATAVSPFSDHSRSGSSSAPGAAFPSYYTPPSTNTDPHSRYTSPEPSSTVTTLSRNERASLLPSQQHPSTTPAYLYPSTSKAAQAGYAVANPNTTPLSPQRFNANNMVSPTATDVAYGGVARDEDSGLRFEDGRVVEILPPGYTLA